jgi:hypothetical protein
MKKGFLERFWFVEAPAARLAWARILIGGFACWYLLDRFRSYLAVGTTPPDLFDPVGVMTLLGAPLPFWVWNALLAGAVVASFLFIAGWCYRVTGPLFAVLFLLVLSYRNSWSMIYHSYALLVLHLIVLALAPAADALSLDSLRRQEQGGPKPASLVSWEYGWPIRLLCAVTAATYFLAGVAKVAGPLGWSWGYGEALRSQVAMDAFRKELLGSTPSPLAFQIYDQLALFTASGVGTLLIELGAPLALLGRRLAIAWVLAAFAMHWGVWFIMDIDFQYHQLGFAFVPFLPLERIAGGLRYGLERLGASLKSAKRAGGRGEEELPSPA